MRVLNLNNSLELAETCKYIEQGSGHSEALTTNTLQKLLK